MERVRRRAALPLVTLALTWLTDANIITPPTSGTYRIYAFDQGTVSAESNYALRIPRDGSYTYWFDFRQAITNFPDAKWSQNGLEVRYGGESPRASSGATMLLDMTPGSRGYITTNFIGLGPYFATMHDAPLQIGRTYTDAGVDLHVTPIKKGGTAPESLDVVVNFGPFLPANRAPTASISPATLTLAADVPLQRGVSGLYELRLLKTRRQRGHHKQQRYERELRSRETYVRDFRRRVYAGGGWGYDSATDGDLWVSNSVGHYKTSGGQFAFYKNIAPPPFLIPLTVIRNMVPKSRTVVIRLKPGSSIAALGPITTYTYTIRNPGVQITDLVLSGGTASFGITNLYPGATNRVLRSRDLFSPLWTTSETFSVVSRHTNWSEPLSPPWTNVFCRILSR